MVGKIILGAVEVVPDNFFEITEIPKIGMFDFGAMLLDGLKEAIWGLFEWGAMGIINNSYWICLIAAIIGILLYAAGLKKAGKYASVSIVIYIILQVLGIAIKSA